MKPKQPLVGITGNYGDKGCELAEGYYLSVLQAGGTPVAIPPYSNKEALLTLLDKLDAIIFSGGGDINPLLLGEEPLPQLRSVCPQRDEAELLLAREAYRRQIPMLGICRGIQIMAAALGGKNYQDIYTQGKGATIKHSQDMPRHSASHTVNITEGSLLQHIFGGKQTLAVNSFHHQAVCEAGPHLSISATSPDGIIEAIESNQHKALLGVQWHPECFTLAADQSMMPIFQWLTSEAETFAQAKHIHRTSIILDSHCDTPMFFKDDNQKNIQMFGTRSDEVLVNLPKMTEGRLDASIMVAYLPQGERNETAYQEARKKADTLLTQIDNIVQANSQYAGLAQNRNDILQLKAEGKKAILKGIENGYAIGRDISLLQHFKQRGIVYMTLCHNGDNDICDSARGNNEHGGISPFGAA